MPNVELEKIHISQFLKLLLGEGIEATVQEPPEPDFYIVKDANLIGIEHTRLIRQKDNSGVDIMAHSTIADKIMILAKNLYNEKCAMCLNVRVNFKCDYGLIGIDTVQLHNNDLRHLSKFIADFVYSQVSNLATTDKYQISRFEAFDNNKRIRILPEKINRITITNTSNLSNSCWYAGQAGAIPGIFQSDEFKTVLEKKNRKPNNYKRNYSEIWLLIVENEMNITSYFHFDDQEPIEIEMTFNRVFVLRHSNNVLVELKSVGRN